MARQAKLSNSENNGDDDAFNDMYGSAWVSPDDIKKPFYSRIEAWERQTFNVTGGKGEKDKYVLTLRGLKKKLVLNKTNALNLAIVHGKNPNNWIGKSVLVKTEMTSYAGKPTPGVRIHPVDPNDMNDDITF